MYRFDFAGIWGGGATFTERSLKWTGENTIYSTGSQAGFLGPREGGAVELAPAIWGWSDWGTFLERYGDLPSCEVWMGREVVGLSCDVACGRLASECGYERQGCHQICSVLPRHYVDCLTSVPACDVAACDLPAPLP